jgi:hypothetical protein
MMAFGGVRHTLVCRSFGSNNLVSFARVTSRIASSYRYHRLKVYRTN